MVNFHTVIAPARHIYNLPVQYIIILFLPLNVRLMVLLLNLPDKIPSHFTTVLFRSSRAGSSVRVEFTALIVKLTG